MSTEALTIAKLQSRWRSRAVRSEVQAAAADTVAPPDKAVSREAQFAALPKDESGNLLPLCCALENFKIFGSGVYCYMIWVRLMQRVFISAFLINLPTFFNNVAGNRLPHKHITFFTSGTLGCVRQ